MSYRIADLTSCANRRVITMINAVPTTTLRRISSGGSPLTTPARVITEPASKPAARAVGKGFDLVVISLLRYATFLASSDSCLVRADWSETGDAAAVSGQISPACSMATGSIINSLGISL